VRCIFAIPFEEILPLSLRLDKREDTNEREGSRSISNDALTAPMQTSTGGHYAGECGLSEAGPFMIPPKNFLLPNLPDDPAE
jgi:hypothetical protein